ncbi:MAG TPA: hypothetical protein VFH78_11150 [Candidatus Thermoplasmatota archaeon]|nr:hypothetical protein [Candidatus Thermoplasmatota archaeon]
MPNHRSLLAIVLVGAALAGCANNGGDTQPTPTSTPAGATPTTSTPTSTPATTPAASPTAATPTTTSPAVTPPSPTPGGGAGGDATVTRVYVTSAPEKAANGTSADVCWRVEGTGTIPHTALHWDTSPKGDAGFAAYANAVYPDNGPAAGTHRLPGTFCATLGPVSGTIYYKAHAMVDPTRSVLGPEEVIIAGSGNNTVDLVGAPDVFTAGQSWTFCWELPGSSGTSTHTALHYDTTSHPNATGIADYPEAVYPDNGPATMEGSFALPGPFCANITMPASGTLFLRAHAITPNGSFLGPERSVAVGPRIAVSGGLPATAAAGSAVEVCWRAEGSGVSTHTALHWDTTSHPNAISFQDYPNAVYPDNGPATTTGSFTLPGPFCAELTMPQSGTLYFRPHAIYPAPGGQVLGDEYAIRVA